MASIIETREIAYRYPTGSRDIFKNCSFCVGDGELLTILGPNGTGKSTLLDCLNGLNEVRTGQVLLDGRDIKNMSRKEIAQIISYVRQVQHPVFAHTVYEYIMMGRAPHIGIFEKPKAEDEDIVTSIIKEMRLEPIAGSAITEISGGELQKATIAQAVAQQPKAIFFDEPTAHLDYGNQIRVLELISSLREKGVSVVMTTHNPDHCFMLGCDVAVLSQEGILTVGSVEETLNQETLKKIYDTDIRVTYISELNRKVCLPGMLNSSIEIS